ncbi:hypothetical protein NQ176_g3127 [Zarea fungicola]|uniref:Uncharacterized protein n=1 Tax=Zarea fungicola TaxID=93591 RepID=A0ACC1NL37_9HYPO|nr:hypothetical protein NQ176_g3127 [Lecanicillium fungicola]
MLSISPLEAKQTHIYCPQPHCISFHPNSNIPAALASSVGSSSITNVDMPHRLPDPDSLVAGVPSNSPAFSLKAAPSSSVPLMSEVSQALEIARESPAGASDLKVRKLLDQAISHIWAKVQAQPDEYVMTREEFSVFNYFQHRFVGDRKAVAARARYWDNCQA